MKKEFRERLFSKELSKLMLLYLPFFAIFSYLNLFYFKARRFLGIAKDEINVGRLLFLKDPIQSSFNLLNPGGLIFIPAGSWTIATNLSVPSNVKTNGAGDATILTLGAGNSGIKIFTNSDTVGGNDNITIANLSIDGNRDNRTLVDAEYGIYFSNVDGLTIKNVHIINMIYEDIFLGAVTNFLVDNYTSENGFTCGLDLGTDVRWGRVSNCYVENMNDTGAYFADAIRLNGADVVCSNCVVNGSSDRAFGIGTGTWALRAKRISIENCVGYDTRDYPFFFGYAENCSIKGCYAHGKGDSAFQASSGGGGIGARYVKGLIIDGNICEDNWFNGIAVGSDQTSGDIAERVTVSNNICFNNSGGGTAQSGIWLLSAIGGGATVQDVNITGNICFDDQDTRTQASGIKVAGIAGTFKRIQINSNFCFGNVNWGINAAGGSVVGIVGNFCFNNQTGGISANNAATLTIQGNTCFDDQATVTQDYGIYVTQSGLTPDVIGLILSGNNCFRNDKNGIYVYTLSGDTFTYSSICNNVCRNNSQLTANTYSGILLEETTYCSLIGNISTGSRQKYGIESTGTSDYLKLAGNILNGNGTAEMLLTGANNDIVEDADGWTNAAQTWTYASASTFTVSGDVTAIYTKGTKLKWTQTTVKYGVVVSSSYSSPNTTVTIAVNTDYTIANATISANFYSYAVNPQGYPGWFAYTPTYTGFSANPGQAALFCITGRTCHVTLGLSSVGTSNATTLTITMPVASANLGGTDSAYLVLGRGYDNGAEIGVAMATLPKNSAVLTCSKGNVGTAWTNSGTKFWEGIITYQI